MKQQQQYILMGEYIIMELLIMVAIQVAYGKTVLSVKFVQMEELFAL